MFPDRLSRRRAIVVLAATAASLPLALRPQAVPAYEWRGAAMGGDARILLHGTNAAEARAALESAVAEIERLEGILSLFRSDSEIRRLNRDGVLAHPSGDMRRAMILARELSEATDGLFDPTVQALWEAYIDWFSAEPRPGLPPDPMLANARAAVDWQRLSVAADVIRLGPGQRVTLNGLGQGYVTDRVADLLHARGFTHVLLDLGEPRALGPQADGAPWRIGLPDAPPIALSAGALATSEGSGCILGAAGAAHHLFDPRSGRSADRWRRVSVHHPRAAVADGLSTALYAATVDEIERLLQRFTDATVWATDRDGIRRQWASRPTPT
ncbi:MAG: FAD:protein FMN transferase [Hyphomicrobiales bacterium]|nr:FAD:protein FMN transferase [Hyphomicrobiales bacterium]